MEVCEVCQNINDEHQQRAANQSQGHIALGILDFSRHHAEIVPSVISPERRNGGHAERGQQSAMTARRKEGVEPIP